MSIVNKHPQKILADQGRDLIEKIGEYYIYDRFNSNCSSSNPLFDAARVERFTRGSFPRFLLDPASLDFSKLEIKTLENDVEFLTTLVKSNPDGLKKLITATNDPDAFVEIAESLKLTEPYINTKKGGLIWFVVIAAAALILSGCGGSKPKCGRPCTVAGITGHPPTCSCQRSKGHGGNHLDDNGLTF